jgi:hypothetical protein
MENSSYGIIAYPKRLTINVKSGDNKKKRRSPLLGKKLSFTK